MNEKVNIETLVKEKLGEKELVPSLEAWSKTYRKLRFRQFTRFNARKFNLFYAIGSIAVVVGVVALLSDGEKQEASQIELLPAVTDEMLSNDLQENLQNRQSDERQSNEKQSDERQSGTNNMRKEQNGSESIAGPSASGKGDTQESERTQSETDSEVTDTNTPGYKNLVTYFTSSVRSGCAPLVVKFTNLSENADSYFWTLGTDEVLLAENPSHLFPEPGSYSVILTASNSDGQTSSFRTMIEVHPKPVAEFEIEEGLEDIDGNRELNLLNYSRGATSYSWKLLAISERNGLHENLQWHSDEFQPSLKMSDLEKKTDHVKLIVSNELGCVDSFKLLLPEAAASGIPTIQFPTAFSPNSTGSIGGQFEPNEARTDIFHPIFNETPLEYHLRIFTRSGQLVFETRSIYTG